MNKLVKPVTFLTVAFLLYWLLNRYTSMSPAKASPVILFASYDSGVAGSWLELCADGTYQYTSAAFTSETVTAGRYTLSDSVILLSRLPEKGLLKSAKLLVRYSPKHAPEYTGKTVWQTNKAGKVDSSLVVFTVYHPTSYTPTQ